MGMKNFTRVTSTRGKNAVKKEIGERIEKHMGEGAKYCDPIHSRVEENNRYSRGFQWKAGDIQRQEAKERPADVMNKIQPALSSIANREIMNRFVSKVYGRDRSARDSGIADVGSEFIRWVRDQAEIEHEESSAFRSLVGSGYACIHTNWDMLENDGAGRIDQTEIPLWNMIWDPRAKKQNLVDRRWHICGKYVSRIEAEEEYADVSKQSKQLFTKLKGTLKGGQGQPWELNLEESGGGAAGRWPWASLSSGKWYNRTDDEVFMVEYEWREVTTHYKIAKPVLLDFYTSWIAGEVPVYFDPMSQMATPQPPMPDPNDPEAQPPQGIMAADLASDVNGLINIRDQLLSQTDAVVVDKFSEVTAYQQEYEARTGEEFSEYAKFRKYSVKYAIYLGGEVLEHGIRKMGFTYEFMTGIPHHTREGTHYYGFVDMAKGPQDWRNAMMSLVLTRLAHSPKAPLMMEEGAVNSKDTFANNAANPAGILWVKDGTISGSAKRYDMLPPPSFPPLERELIDIAERAVPEQAGLSASDLGFQGDMRRVSGAAISSVKEAANTILACYFDSLRRYRRRSGFLILRYMVEMYTPEEVALVIGDEHSQHLFDMEDWPEIELYDIKVEESPTSKTERQEIWDYLTRTGTLENWIDRYIPFDLVIEWFPGFTESDRNKIREYSKTKETEQQTAQQLASLQEALQADENGKQLLIDMNMLPAEFDSQGQPIEAPPQEGG